MFAEPLTELPPSLNESGTRLYTDSEIDLLIDDLTVAALEAIEQAAGEAAKAAMLASLDREAATMREATFQRNEALRWRTETERQIQEVKAVKKEGVKNAIIAGAICLLSGIALGVSGTLIIGGK